MECHITGRLSSKKTLHPSSYTHTREDGTMLLAVGSLVAKPGTRYTACPAYAVRCLFTKKLLVQYVSSFIRSHCAAQLVGSLGLERLHIQSLRGYTKKKKNTSSRYVPVCFFSD